MPDKRHLDNMFSELRLILQNNLHLGETSCHTFKQEHISQGMFLKSMQIHTLQSESAKTLNY